MTSTAMNEGNAARLARLKHSELTELVQRCVEKHRDLESELAKSLAKADARLHAKSLKAPRKVDYTHIASEFYKTLHKNDSLSRRQMFDRSHEVAQSLRTFITEVVESVNENSSEDVVETAFDTLFQFMRDMKKTQGGKKHKKLMQDWEDPVEFVCRGLRILSLQFKVKELEPTEEDIQEIEEWAKEWPRVKFGDLLSDWKNVQDGEEDGGSKEDEKEQDSNEDIELEDEDEEDEYPSRPQKRARRLL
jgi:hypothetical protein